MTNVRYIAFVAMALYGTFLVTIAGSWFFHVLPMLPTDPIADKLVLSMCFLTVALGCNLIVFALFEIVHPNPQAT